MPPKKMIALTKKNNFTLSELEISKVKSALTTRDYAALRPIYELMLAKDSHIAAEVMRRRLALQGAYFECGAKIDFWDTVDALMDSVLTGAAVFELFADAGKMMWEPLNPSVLQYEKDSGFFVQPEKGEKINPAEDKRLYLATAGQGALFSLIWIFCAKHFVLSHYMKFTELLGVPPLIVNADSSDAEEIGDIADMAEQLTSGGVGVFGKDDTVNILEGRGSQSDFLEFVRYCDTQISLGLVGNTLSGNEGKSGSLAMSQTHQESFSVITIADARYVEKNINKLLARCSQPADFKYIIEKEKDLKTRAETLNVIRQMGYTIPLEYLEKEFDIPGLVRSPADFNTTSMGLQRLQDMGLALSEGNIFELFGLKKAEGDTLQPKENPLTPAANRKEANAKAGDGDAIDNAALDADTRRVEREIAERIEAIFANTKSFDEAHAALSAAYPDIELPELEKTLERLIANSYIQGRIEI